MMATAPSSTSPRPARGAPLAAPSAPLEALLRPLVRVYEEQLLVDVAANLFREFARQGGIPRADIARLLADYPPSAVHSVFSRYDRANRGVIDARSFLALVRYLNFGNGFCDACFAPIGELERGFMCVECRAGGYILCAGCYPQRGGFHQPTHRFLPSNDMLELLHPSDSEEIPKGVGVFLRAHLTSLFNAMDPTKRGVITHADFRAFQRLKGCAESYVDFLLAQDEAGNGLISRKKLLYLVTGQHMIRQCDECGALKFVGQNQIMSCLECVADYDVCADCWLASKCRHEHCNFRMAEPFQLRFAGLYYRFSHDDMWSLAVGNYDLWGLYEPFLADRLQTYAQVGLPTPFLLFLACSLVNSLSNSPVVSQLGPPRAYGHYVLPSSTNPPPTSYFGSAGPAFDENAAANPLQQPQFYGDASVVKAPSSAEGMDAAGEVLSWFLR